MQRAPFEALRLRRAPLHQSTERRGTRADSFPEYPGSQLSPQGQRFHVLRFPSPSILETLNFICVEDQ